MPFEDVRMMTRVVPESLARTLAASRASSLEPTLGGCCARVAVAVRVRTRTNRNVARERGTLNCMTWALGNRHAIAVAAPSRGRFALTFFVPQVLKLMGWRIVACSSVHLVDATGLCFGT